MESILNKDLFNNDNMVENPIVNEQDLEIKLFRAELAYADDQKKKASVVEMIPDWMVGKLMDRS